MRMHPDQVDSDADLVRRLLVGQYPQWADLAIERVASSGTDNAIYRLGTELVVRLPLIHWAVGQVEKEHVWLPRLAPRLPLAVPEPVATGEPGEGYPWRWSVYRWIEGVDAHPDCVADLQETAIDLARFVTALHSVDVPDAPESPRAVKLVTKDAQIRGAIAAMRHQFDAAALTAAWEEAIAAPPWDGPSVLVHGDLSEGNLLLRDGRLHAVIDFSCFGLGEPANDLDIAWELFSGPNRDAYRAAVGADEATWSRGRGWAITAVFGIGYYEHTNPRIVARLRRRLAGVLAERH
ncbi:MAG TPA: aminoglycoside phosphotransferase family protein [Acidimicrobiia bacterium]|nr:aminoglycoside phosphotransferase family protein [Acidimicrobiia bacterium]